MIRNGYVFACLILLCLLSTAHADSWAPPAPKIFSTAWGEFGCKVLPPPGQRLQFGRPSLGVVFKLDNAGSDVTVYQFNLVNIPHRLLLTDDAQYVVTMDSHGRVGYEHSLVIYGKNGRLIRDFALEDLLTEPELEKVPTSVSSRWWSQAGQFAFDENQEYLLIKLQTGTRLKVQLKTGKVQREETMP